MRKYIVAIVFLGLMLFLAVLPKSEPQKEYIIVFFTNGGDNIPSMTVPSNSKVRAPKDPVRTSSEFAGWYTTINFEEGTEFDFNTTVITESITLYAKWQLDEFTITYNWEGGTLAEGAINSYRMSFTYEDRTVFFKPSNSAHHPRHEEYGRFTGWREISQADYNNLSAEEKTNYPFMESIEPKGDLIQIYPDKEVVLYAHYRNFPSS